METEHELDDVLKPFIIENGQFEAIIKTDPQLILAHNIGMLIQVLKGLNQNTGQLVVSVNKLTRKIDASNHSKK